MYVSLKDSVRTLCQKCVVLGVLLPKIDRQLIKQKSSTYMCISCSLYHWVPNTTSLWAIISNVSVKRSKTTVLLTLILWIFFSQAKEIKLHSNEPGIEKESYDVAVRLIRFFETREEGVSDRKNTKNSVLVFLPGMAEIEEMHALLKSEQKDSLRYL